MATSNFTTYNTLPGIYFMTYDEIEQRALNGSLGIEYDSDNPDNFFDEIENYIHEHYKGYRILFEEEIKDLEAQIEECNDVLWQRACRLYESPRYQDGQEYDALRHTKIVIEGGYYEGAQLAVKGDYAYLNKTSKRLVRKLFMRLARRFYLPIYKVAYRFSNGETAFTKIRDCKPTPKERAMGW